MARWATCGRPGRLPGRKRRPLARHGRLRYPGPVRTLPEVFRNNQSLNFVDNTSAIAGAIALTVRSARISEGCVINVGEGRAIARREAAQAENLAAILAAHPSSCTC